MDQSSRFNVARLWYVYGRRLMKYGGVTVVSTVVGVSSLIVGLYVFDWHPIFANFISVCMSTPPAYLLNRQWVWEQDSGGHSVAGEIGPFWIVTLLGFVVSTLAVGVVSELTERRLVIVFTQIAAFGSLWLIKFVFLEKVLWKDSEVRVREGV